MMGIFELTTHSYDLFTLPLYSRDESNIKEVPLPEIERIGNEWKRKGSTDPSIIDDCETTAQFLKKLVSEFKGKTMIGTRSILSKEDAVLPNGRKIVAKELSNVLSEFSYQDIDLEVFNLMKGFHRIGIKPQDIVTIFMDTCKEWILSCLSIFNMRAIMSTLYATLGDNGLVSGLEQTKSEYIITSNELLPKLVTLIPQMKHLKYVIVVTDIVGGKVEDICIKDIEGVQVYSYHNIIAEAQMDKTPFESEEVNGDDVAFIMFTSGSTGDPKGVVMTHSSFIHGVRNLHHAVKTCPKSDDAWYLAYLPMAHIMELLCFFFNTSLDHSIGFGTPQTLMESPYLAKGSRSDFQVIKPDMVPTVPLMVDRMRKEFETKGKEKWGSYFEKIVKYKIDWYESGRNTPIIDKFVVPPLKEIFGGKLQTILCGGAPLSESSQIFMRDVIGADIFLIWASTETAGSGTTMEGGHRYIGRAGIPLFNTTIKLQDWEEGGYTSKDVPNPRGELLIHCDSLATEYYHMPDQTADAFVTDETTGRRWWVSGDVGEVFPDGTFKIIDRKKDLVKLQFGEYISLGKVEAALKGVPIVDNVCIVADSFHTYITAVVVPNKIELSRLAESLELKDKTFEQLCDDPKIMEGTLKQMKKYGREVGLLGAEIPKKVTLVKELWTTENNLVTAGGLKIRRRQIQDFYSESIKTMFHDVLKS